LAVRPVSGCCWWVGGSAAEIELHLRATAMTGRLEPSRRDFLAASAAGLIGLARSASNLAADESVPDGELLYVGTYTDDTPSEGIYLVRMDPRSGELRQVGSVSASSNASFLAIHPSGRALYAVSEVTEHNGKAAGAVS